VLALVLPLFALVRVGTVRQPTRERAASLLRGTAGPLAGLALAGFFLVPLVVGSPEIHLEAVRGEPGAERYAEQFVRLPQLYVRELWDETRWSLRPGAERRGMRDMPYYFGVVLAAALVVTAVAGARRRGADEPPLLALATVGIVSFALVLEPSARLLAAVPGLPTLQFPWRFLGPASVAAALGLALLAHRAEGAWRRLPALGASLLALAALGDGFPYSGAVGRAAPWDGLVRLGFGRNGTGVIHGAEVARPWPLRVKGSFFPPWRCCADVGETFWVYPEYFTPAARRLVDDPGRAVEASIGMYGFVVEGRIRAWPYARLWRPGAQRAIALPFRRGGGEIVVELPRGARGRVEIAEQHFPGWQVEVDGRWQEAGRGANGLIEAVAMRRSRTLRFRFERWRADRVAGWILSLLAAGGLVAAVRRDPLSRRTR
jgi:hypothetical protein